MSTPSIRMTNHKSRPRELLQTLRTSCSDIFGMVKTRMVKCRSKWPTYPPFSTPKFWPISAHSASTVSTKNFQLALKVSRSRAFQRAIGLGEPCTFPVSPPKGGTKRDVAVFASKIQLLPQNENFYIWRSLHFFVAGNRRHFKFNMWVEHSKS